LAGPVKEQEIKPVIFIHSQQPAIDRGWKTEDISGELVRLGHTCFSVRIQTMADFEALIPVLKESISWPVCYTVGAQISGPSVVALLEASECAYIGANSTDLRMSSKLVFKERLKTESQYSTPEFLRVKNLKVPSDISILGLPVMLKTEFSCNSEGVSFIGSVEIALKEILRLQQKFSQEMYFERWERTREYTVAYLPPSGGRPSIAATVELTIKSGAIFIDQETKQDNTKIAYSRPEEDVAKELERVTMDIADILHIDGYFRIDYLENLDGEFYPIELNFLPYLSNSGGVQSYFPQAMSFVGIDYTSVVSKILNHAQERGVRGFLTSDIRK
jgi:D-alanine-D-alanine ligase-like ATP-grasp enzyme